MQFNYKLTKYDISINEWAGVVQVKNMKPVWEFLYTQYTYNLLSSSLYSKYNYRQTKYDVSIIEWATQCEQVWSINQIRTGYVVHICQRCRS